MTGLGDRKDDKGQRSVCGPCLSGATTQAGVHGFAYELLYCLLYCCTAAVRTCLEQMSSSESTSLQPAAYSLRLGSTSGALRKGLGSTGGGAGGGEGRSGQMALHVGRKQIVQCMLHPKPAHVAAPKQEGGPKAGTHLRLCRVCLTLTFEARKGAEVITCACLPLSRPT